MEEQSRHFAFRILAFHGVLLLVVLALLGLASLAIYDSARQDAVEQATVRQELLAQQTGRGIETFYSALISDLGWIWRQGPTQTPPPPGATSSTPRRTEAGRDRSDERLVSAQLGGRVSALFAYNKQTDAVVSILPKQATLTSAQLPEEMQQWLRGVEQVKVSSLVELNGKGVCLVAASFSSTDPLLLVAVVPGEQIDRNFLRSLNDQNSAGVTLADSRLDVMTSTNRNLTGLNLADFDDPGALDMLRTFQEQRKTVSRLFRTSLNIRGVPLGPRLLTLAPVAVAQEHWVLLFAQPVQNIDSSVNRLFSRAAYWAVLVAASITAILVSTALQMIRWQSRLHRQQHQALEQELQQARRIQKQWLPETIPPGLDVAATNQPANHISGDFYNWFPLPDGRHAVVIGDVTGHGMAAAFLMATTQLLVRNTMVRIPDPGTAMEEVNNQLTSQMFRGQFVTMLILTLDFEKRRLDAASAGHPPPLIFRDNNVCPLELQADLVLGVEKQVRYSTQRFTLPESSGLLLYTDGVVDVEGDDHEIFGIQRLKQSLAGGAARFVTAHDMIDAVLQAVQRFHSGRELEDDLTLVAIQWRRAAAAMVTPPATEALPSAAPAGARI
jgi:serine phosphatase RsbU (regulator of sigma subunit)